MEKHTLQSDLTMAKYLPHQQAKYAGNVNPSNSNNAKGAASTHKVVIDGKTYSVKPGSNVQSVQSSHRYMKDLLSGVVNDAVENGFGGAIEGQGKQLTNPSKIPDPDAIPEGTPTKVNYNDKDINNIKALEGENEAAKIFAKNGYDIEQNPKILETDRVAAGRNPDYRLEKELADCYTPTTPTKSVRGIWSEVEGKVLKEQTQRVVVNLEKSQWSGDVDKLIAQFQEWPIDKLEEVFIIDKSGNIQRIFPQ